MVFRTERTDIGITKIVAENDDEVRFRRRLHIRVCAGHDWSELTDRKKNRYAPKRSLNHVSDFHNADDLNSPHSARSVAKSQMSAGLVAVRKINVSEQLNGRVFRKPLSVPDLGFTLNLWLHGVLGDLEFVKHAVRSASTSLSLFSLFGESHGKHI